MENRFKLKISRMFRSSFSSCRTRKISDDIGKPEFSPQNYTFHLVEPFSSPPRSNAQHRGAAINAPRQTHTRRKSSARHTSFSVSAADIDGFRKCPPSAKPLNIFSDCKDYGFYEKKKSLPRNKHKKKKKNTKRVSVKSKYLPSQETATYSNNNNTYYGTEWWFSSSEDDETETFFSSRIRSSDSSESLKKHRSDCRKMRQTRRRRAKNELLLPLEGTSEVKGSFAVVKSSSDPYNDFRTSMVEMIIERQIFAAKGLEELLQCFLSLNSPHHHNIIVEVFTEIWAALFSS